MHWTIILLTNLLCVHLAIPQYVGETCTTKDSSEGKCIMYKDCAPAVIAFQKKQFGKYNICGYNISDPIVCCPDQISETGPQQPQINQRISEIECKKITASFLPSLDQHILGGELAGTGEFPHMVGLGYDRGDGYDFNCGGSILSPNYVISVAHCTDNVDRISPTIIRSGVIEITGREFNELTDVRISETIYHPQYQRKEKYHDVVLLRLAKPLDFNANRAAVCLGTSSEDPKVPLTVTGWGTTNNTRDIRSSLLLKANVTAVSIDKCNTFYTNWRKLPTGIMPTQICAGDPLGVQDTCQGDSGGPLVVTADNGQNILVGLTSFGRGCGSEYPGVYTRVSSYLDWIEGIVWRQK